MERLKERTDPSLRRLRGSKVMILDVETTGLKGHDRIVEIAIVQIDALLEKHRAEPRVILSTFVDPEMPIPAEASRIHGIRDEHVKGSPTWARVWGRIGGWLTDPYETLCAHNAPFDRSFVAELRFEPADNAEVRPASEWLDTLRIVKRVDGGDPTPGSGTLKRACEIRGIQPGTHRAWTDAMATAHLLLRLIPEAYALPEEQRPPVRPSIREWLTWQNAGSRWGAR